MAALFMEKGYGMNHRWGGGWGLRDRGILEFWDWEIADGRFLRMGFGFSLLTFHF
jgi:hypothetical protein